jgi:hypothetical protein
VLNQSNAQITTQPAGSLVLEQLPSGEWAWLRPEIERVWLTDRGRRALAMDALFGRPWPTVAEVGAVAEAVA